MKDLKNKVAVITGSASGFGRELAILCAQEGMRVVMTDVDVKGLQATNELLKPFNAQTLVMKCNVADAAEVERVALQTYEKFGAAHLLFNNAGVASAGPIWTTTLEDWQWTLGVNLMGVVHGIRSFVPRMLKQGDECHVVNTASVAGLLAVPASSVYCVSKHGVVVMSECLHHELQAARSAIKVSVLCPAFVNTGIADAARNRPQELAATSPESKPYEEWVRQATRKGKLTATDIARITMEGVKSDRFYILTHPAIKPTIETRMRDILEERTPTSPMAK
jgi:NAD(P)-dependent dehydrogenase (short-subunit alcohol dehydrogenase family)